MNILNHVDNRLLENRKVAAIVLIVSGALLLWVPIIGIFFILFGCVIYNQCGRLKQEFSLLQAYPYATFTQIGQSLHIKSQTVRNDLTMAVTAKILIDIQIDGAREMLIYPLPPTPPPPPPPREVQRTIDCPNCGANVTISSLHGGQCEYCDSYLSGIE